MKQSLISSRIEESARTNSIIHDVLKRFDVARNTVNIYRSFSSAIELEKSAIDYRFITANKRFSSFNKVLEFNERENIIKKGINKFKSGLDNFKYLVQRGWYVSTKVLDNLELNSLSEVYELTKKKNIANFESYIIESFDGRKARVFDYLKQTVSSRSHIFEEIENLYNSKCYYGLINLCYSQADGISNENWNIGFFDTDQKSRELKIKLLKPRKRTFSKSISGQLVHPRNEMNLYSKDPTLSDKTVRDKSINRHLIIHGHSIHYGTKTNAIRAILLLEFICDLIEENFR